MGKEELFNLREMSSSGVRKRKVRFPALQKSTVEKPMKKSIFSIFPEGIMRNVPTFHQL